MARLVGNTCQGCRLTIPATEVDRIRKAGPDGDVAHCDNCGAILVPTRDASTTGRSVQCDGGSRGNPGPAAIGAVVLDATVDPPALLATVSECIGVATNNVAEYEALIAGLEAAREFERAPASTCGPTPQLLIRQLEGRYRVKNAQPRAAATSGPGRCCAEYDEVDLGTCAARTTPTPTRS